MASHRSKALAGWPDADRAPGRRQVGIEPALEFLLESVGGRMPHRRQVGIGIEPCLEIEPVAQRKGPDVVPAKPVQDGRRISPCEALPPRLQGRQVLGARAEDSEQIVMAASRSRRAWTRFPSAS